MAVERPPSAFGFMFRIKMQHYSCDFAPVSTFHIRVEQAQIRDEVLLVVSGQHGIGGRGIGDIRIKRRRLHGRSRNRMLIDQLCFGLLGILMTAKPPPLYIRDAVPRGHPATSHHTDCGRSNALSRRGRERLHLRWVADNVAYGFLASILTYQPLVRLGGVMRALHRHKPKARPAPRWKAPKVYRFIRWITKLASLFGLCRGIPRISQDRFCGPVALAA